MISIAIDGPSGSGKSTISKCLSKRLGFLTLDTGALYRALAYCFFKRKFDYRNCTDFELNQMLKKIVLKVSHSDGYQRTYVNNDDVTDNIRDPKISMIASEISALEKVRSYLLDFQREFAKKHDVVMDGRDIGTVVLPNADVKIFLTASVDSRVQRRYDQILKNSSSINIEDVKKSILKRDFNDSVRKASPLKPAKDAVVVDNSNLNLEETLNKIMKIIGESVKIETKQGTV